MPYTHFNFLPSQCPYAADAPAAAAACRVLWFAVMRSCALVLVSICQVVGIKYMFRAR